MMHYGLGWYNDRDNAGSPRAWLSGHGGIKMFTEGMSRLVIDKDGDVGIGIDSPSDKLHINGNLRTDEDVIIGSSDEGIRLKNNGEIRIKNTLPFVVQIITLQRDDPSFETNFSSSSYVVFIGGFKSQLTRVSSNSGLMIWTETAGGKWFVRLDVKTPQESEWKVRVIAIRRELVQVLPDHG